MNEYYEQFLKFLEAQDKQGSVNYALQLLSSKKLGIVSLYTEILQKALNEMVCHNDEKELCIWQEHTRSAIVRTIIECCYPYVVSHKPKSEEPPKSVIVICPDGEYHELGARMAADFFELCGFHAIFVGGSTPKNEFIKAIKYLKPTYIAIGVTNKYNLVSTKRIITEIRKQNENVVITVGGSAFLEEPQLFKEVGADAFVHTYEDIEKLAKEGI